MLYRFCPAAQRLALSPFRGTGGRDETTLFYRTQLQATQTAWKRADSHQSGAPSNDGRRSFSTKERLAVWTKNGQKLTILQEKDAIFATSGCRSENAVLGGVPHRPHFILNLRPKLIDRQVF